MDDESSGLGRRAAVHAALGEPARLAIVDALAIGDKSPGELGESLRLPANLLAHHLRAARHGLTVHPGRTAHVRDVIGPGDLIVAVCDNAYEELGHHPRRLHWSVPDPARAGSDEAFERAFADIEGRVGRLSAVLQPSGRCPGDPSGQTRRTP